VRSLATGIILLPLRALRWLYAPHGRTRPGQVEIEAHQEAASLGLDTARWKELDEAQRREVDERHRRE
jgi:hypothetical protein